MDLPHGAHGPVLRRKSRHKHRNQRTGRPMRSAPALRESKGRRDKPPSPCGNHNATTAPHHRQNRVHLRTKRPSEPKFPKSALRILGPNGQPRSIPSDSGSASRLAQASRTSRPIQPRRRPHQPCGLQTSVFRQTFRHQGDNRQQTRHRKRAAYCLPRPRRCCPPRRPPSCNSRSHAARQAKTY